MTTRYWVYDKDDSKTGFPLETLLRLVLAFFDFKILQVLVHRAEGYGEKLLSWDQLLFNPEDQVTSSLEELLEVLRDDEEIIYKDAGTCTVQYDR